MIRVALDVSAVPSQPAGAGRYIVELVRALSRRADLELTLVSRRDDAERWEGYGGGATLLPIVPASRPARLAYERWALGRRIDRIGRGSGGAAGIGVYHAPHYTMPSTTGCGRVVTVHDVTFLEHPEWHERSKVALFQSAIRRAAREADVVICVSRTTAERLPALVELRADVVVAEHGVDHDRFGPGAADPAALPRELAGRELLVHVGTIEPRKGVVDLVRAFDLLAGDRPDLGLVLAGLPGWGAAEVGEAIAAAKHRDRVTRLGWVPDETVVALMRAARAVVYPSHEEGFGLPALEAMAVGAPLVTSSGTAMAEFAGGAAWLSVPGNPAALARAIGEALDAPADEVTRRRLQGLDRSSGFTWDRTAAAHVEAYRLALAHAATRDGPGGSRPDR